MTPPAAGPAVPPPAAGLATPTPPPPPALLAAWLGAEVAELAPAGAEPWPGAGCRTWRVTLADARRFKLRRLRAVADGGVVSTLLREFAASGAAGAARFAGVVDQRGDLLLEEWIDGEPLPDPPPDALLAEAGDLLGRLHAHGRAPGARRADLVPTAAHRASIERQLGDLRAAGALSAATAGRLREAGRAWDPRETEAGVTHRDLCADNLLVGRDGHLVVIDNETMLTGPLDFDLARSDYRWPLAPEQRACFLRAYAAHRDPCTEPAAARFWRLRALTLSACFRLRQAGLAAAAVPLAALRQMDAERQAGEPAAGP